MREIGKKIVFLGLLAVVLAAGRPAQAASTEVVWPAEKIVYKQVIPGVTKAVLSEDPTTGAYTSLTRFAGGVSNPLHTHTYDIKAVVISGTYNYGIDGQVVKLGPGSYALIPGGRQHTSGTDDKGCLFLEESPGKFDINFVKAAK